MKYIQSILDKKVFPTYVGMNRDHVVSFGLPVGVPHIRGDEPENIE